MRVFTPRLEKLTHLLSERLASLSIMGLQLKTALKTLNTIMLWCTGGFSGALNWSPMMPRDDSLSNVYSLLFFRSRCVWYRDKSFSKSCWTKPNSDCILNFKIDLESKEIPFRSKSHSESIWKWSRQSEFGFIKFYFMNQTKLRLYLPFYDWFGTKENSFQF